MEPGLIDRFLPRAEIAESHDTVVAAPADLVFDVASTLDLRSIPLVAAIMWLREKVLGARPPSKTLPKGIVAETLALGWGRLAERPRRELVMGSVTQPWEADVVFTAVAAERFAGFDEAGFVKIVWTLEAEPIDATRTRFRTQTRVLPTDASARRRFKRYWLSFGAGILMIRLLVLRAVRRRAERCFHATVASRDERRRALPADALVPDAIASLTHAITIDAPPERVWPWLAQLGAGRAGWYSYDFIDNGGVPSANSLLAEHLHIAPGQVLPAVPGAKDAFVVASLEPPRDLALSVPGEAGRNRVSWEYHLERQPCNRTRLIVRGRLSPTWLAAPLREAPSRKRPLPIERAYGLLAKLPRPLMLGAARAGHGFMQSHQLREIKRRVEAAP